MVTSPGVEPNFLKVKTLLYRSASSCSELEIIFSIKLIISNSFRANRWGTISSTADKLMSAKAASVLTDFCSSSKRWHKHKVMFGSQTINFLLSAVPVNPGKK